MQAGRDQGCRAERAVDAGQAAGEGGGSLGGQGLGGSRSLARGHQLLKMPDDALQFGQLRGGSFDLRFGEHRGRRSGWFRLLQLVSSFVFDNLGADVEMLEEGPVRAQMHLAVFTSTKKLKKTWF